MLRHPKLLKDCTLKETERYVRWLLQNRNTGVLTEVGRAHLAHFDAYTELVRDDPVGFFRHANPAYANFLAGLTSPDEEQKKRFKTFMSVLGEQTPDRARVLMAVLEHGKQHSGRRRGSKIGRDSEVLRRMKTVVVGGMSIPQAARSFATEVQLGGSLESTAKRLERKYRSGEK